MIENYAVITNCSARKRAGGPVARLAPSELGGGAKQIAARWLIRRSSAPAAMAAGELYVGRAMTESRKVASHLRGPLHIVSAGLGLVAQADRIPNYDLTVGTGNGALGAALAQCGSNPSDWWRELHAVLALPLPLSTRINQKADTLFLVALPSAYIRMLEHDLAQLHDDALDRLRIFTSRMGASLLTERLRRCALPYDERLEGLRGYAGTRSDFPQRAMRHYVEELGGQVLGAQDARQAVKGAMAQLKRPAVPPRTRKSDDEIVTLIRAQWDAHAGSSTRLHRYLRDTALVACEQSRFGDLWRQVKAETQ